MHAGWVERADTVLELMPHTVMGWPGAKPRCRAVWTLITLASAPESRMKFNGLPPSGLATRTQINPARNLKGTSDNGAAQAEAPCSNSSTNPSHFNPRSNMKPEFLLWWQGGPGAWFLVIKCRDETIKNTQRRKLNGLPVHSPVSLDPNQSRARFERGEVGKFCQRRDSLRWQNQQPKQLQHTLHRRSVCRIHAADGQQPQDILSQ
jgi:hypothetical protein